MDKTQKNNNNPIVNEADLKKDFSALLQQVKAEEELKERTRAFISAQYEKQTPVKKKVLHFNFQRAIAAASLVFILLGIGLFFGSYNTKVAAISVDINPSFELGINRYDKVISAESFDETGKNLLETLSLNNKSLSEALTILLDQETEAENVSLTIAAANDDTMELMQAIQAFNKAYMGKGEGNAPLQKRLKIHTFIAPFNSMGAARREGMSFGKYRMLKALQANGLDFSSEDISAMSISEMEEMILQGQKHAGENKQEQGSKQNGQVYPYENNEGQGAGYKGEGMQGQGMQGQCMQGQGMQGQGMQGEASQEGGQKKQGAGN